MLHGSQDCIKYDNSDDHDRAFHIAAYHGYKGGNDQDDHQKVTELLKKNLKGAFALPLLKDIFPALSQPLTGFLTGQPMFRHTEMFQ